MSQSQYLLSKQNIQSNYKTIITDMNLQNMPKKVHENVVSILTTNMKNIYKNSITPSKINNDNFGPIINQYNKACISMTMNEIKNNNVIINDSNIMSQRQTERMMSNNNPK